MKKLIITLFALAFAAPAFADQPGTWLVGPRMGHFQNATGPDGQTRTYVYPYGYGGQYYGINPELQGYYMFGQALKDIRRGQEIDAWLDRELAR